MTLVDCLLLLSLFVAVAVVSGVLYHVDLRRVRPRWLALSVIAVVGIFGLANARADTDATLLLVVIGHDGTIKAAQSSSTMPQAMCESLAAAKREELREQYREVHTMCVAAARRPEIPAEPNLPPAQRGA